MSATAKIKPSAILDAKTPGAVTSAGRLYFKRASANREGHPLPGEVTLIDQTERGDSLGIKYKTLLEADKLVKAGLSVAAIKRMGAASGWSMAEIKKLARISEGTFARRKQAGRLSQEESERLLRLSHLFERAVGLYAGDQIGARQWLQTPIAALGNRSPVDIAQTEPGAREVDDLIGRIEHGIVS